MQNGILQLWHWRLHKLQRGCCPGSLHEEVCLSVCVKGFLSFFLFIYWLQREPEETDAKIRKLELFMHVSTTPWN